MLINLLDKPELPSTVDPLDEPDHVISMPDSKQLNINVDVLLLKNQLPYRVLELYILWENNDETALIRTMHKFLKGYHLTTPDNEKYLLNESQRPTHLLDLQRNYKRFSFVL